MGTGYYVEIVAASDGTSGYRVTVYGLIGGPLTMWRTTRADAKRLARREAAHYGLHIHDYTGIDAA